MSNAKQTECNTLASCETLLTMIETLSGALFFIDDTDTIVYANARAQVITGATREELRGNPLWRSAPQLVSTALYQAVLRIRQTQEPTEVEYRSPVTGSWLHVQLAPSVGGVLLQFHQVGAPAHHQETFATSQSLSGAVLDGLHAGIAVLTPEGIVLEINEAPLAGAHLRREEVIGQMLAHTPWWSSSPASQEQLRAAITCANRGETVRFETLVRPREGLFRHLEVAITPRVDADHHIEYLVIAAIDITARKQAEAEVRVLVDAIPQFVWMLRPDGAADYCNQRWRDYTQMTVEQVQGEGWMRCTHPEDWQRVRAAWQRAVQTGTRYEVEQRLRDGASGAYRWFLDRAAPFTDAQGQITKWFGTSTDIHDKKQAADELHVLIDALPQLVWIMRPDGRCDYCNQRWCDYTGMTFQQAQEDGWLQAIHPEDQQPTLVVWQRAVQTGTPYETEQRVRQGTSGAYRWFLVRAEPFKDAGGQIVKWFGTSTDIEEQKRAEHKLKASEENLRVLAETVPQLVWIERAGGSVEYVNQRYLDYLQARPEQLQSGGWSQFLHPDDAQRTLAAWRHACESGEPYEIEYRLKHGQTGAYRWFLARAMPVRDDTGRIVKWFGTATDIDEQKRTEEALRQSQKRIRALIDSNLIGITSSEWEGEVIVEANEAFLQVTGYSQEDVVQRTLSRARITPPEDAPLFERALQELAAHGQHTPFETELVCKDGSRLPILVGGVLFQERPRQFVAFMLDNAARKELEQRKDTFISMASHELRNPLTALKLQTTLLHRQLAKQGLLASAPALASMEGQITTITRLVEELLDVSRIQAGRLEYRQETVDLDALLQEIVETMQQTHPSHRILLQGAVQAGLIGDRDRLGQVFINLLSNAIKYSPDAQTVEMDLFASPETVTIRVHDHGLGIPREQRDRIFERFYRASDPMQRVISGLGMGLYIVAEIVKRHGGTIGVDSEVGKGSTFTVTLPRMREV
ncbi:MAG TPA: PAS domain S-box protein [Ktedonobacteraceae bacterium]